MKSYETSSFIPLHTRLILDSTQVVKNFMLLSIVAFSGVGTNLRISNILFDFEDGKVNSMIGGTLNG
jgi:hypothetical protein